MNTTLHTLTDRNIQGVLLRPVNVYMAASLNRLQLGGVANVKMWFVCRLHNKRFYDTFVKNGVTKKNSPSCRVHSPLEPNKELGG